MSGFPTTVYHSRNGLSVSFIGSNPQEIVDHPKTDFNSSSPPSSSLSTALPVSIAPNSAIDNLRETINQIKDRANSSQASGNKRVKLLCNWTSSQNLAKDWAKMGRYVDGKTTWTIQNDLSLEIADSPPYDYYVIINKPPDNEELDPAHTIVFRMEPYIETNPFYNQWAKMGQLTPENKNKFMFFLEHEHFRNNTEWWLSKTVDELDKSPDKTRLLSTVVSSQYTMQGHKLRIDFIKYFQEHSNLQLDVYGHDNKFELQHYQGSLPLRQKDAGIFPYKYHLAAENSDIPNYFTEKFNDAILGECLLFYWGCSNIGEHIDPAAFIRLDLNDKPGSLKIIEEAIANDEWSKRIGSIRAEKLKLIHGLNFFPRVCSLIYAHRINWVYLPSSGVPTITIPGIQIHSAPSATHFSVEQTQGLLRHYISSSVHGVELGRIVNHLQQWKVCAQTALVTGILETTAKSNFLDHITSMLAGVPADWDIIFLQSNAEASKATIGNAYLLHPRGAKKILDLVEQFGFFSRIDEQLLLMAQFIPNFKVFYSTKDRVHSSTFPGGDLFHIFHSTSPEQIINTIPTFSFPPTIARQKIVLIKDEELQKHLESIKNQNVK